MRRAISEKPCSPRAHARARSLSQAKGAEKAAMGVQNGINDSINQTISRTIMTSLTTFLAVIVLYIWGGDGVHGFAFAMLVGVFVGTYSSIAIASPILLLGRKAAGKIAAKGEVAPTE